MRGCLPNERPVDGTFVARRFAACPSGARGALMSDSGSAFATYVLLCVVSPLALISCRAHSDTTSHSGRTAATQPAHDLDLADLEQFRSPLESAGWQESGSWPQFAHDPLHTGRADVEFP